MIECKQKHSSMDGMWISVLVLFTIFGSSFSGITKSRVKCPCDNPDYCQPAPRNITKEVGTKAGKCIVTELDFPAISFGHEA